MNLLINVQCPTATKFQPYLVFTPWPLPSSYHQLPGATPNNRPAVSIVVIEIWLHVISWRHPFRR